MSLGTSPAAPGAGSCFGFPSALALLFLRLVKGLAELEDWGCLAWTFTCSFSLYRSCVGRGKSSAYAGVSVKPPAPLDSGPAAGGCSRLQASLQVLGECTPASGGGKGSRERVKLSRERSCALNGSLSAGQLSGIK